MPSGIGDKVEHFVLTMNKSVIFYKLSINFSFGKAAHLWLVS